jgi:hypothetical protein
MRAVARPDQGSPVPAAAGEGYTGNRPIRHLEGTGGDATTRGSWHKKILGQRDRSGDKEDVGGAETDDKQTRINLDAGNSANYATCDARPSDRSSRPAIKVNST